MLTAFRAVRRSAYQEGEEHNEFIEIAKITRISVHAHDNDFGCPSVRVYPESGDFITRRFSTVQEADAYARRLAELVNKARLRYSLDCTLLDEQFPNLGQIEGI